MFSAPQPQQRIQLDLLRHGEPIGGVRYRGSVDDELSENGWQQMQTATQAAKQQGARWDAVISSPMQRCRAFASFFGEQHSLPLTIVENFKELSFGDFEGQTPQQVWQQYATLLGNIWRDPESYTPPNGEPYVKFKQRVAQGLHQVYSQHPNQQLLLVVHGGVIRALLTLLLNIAPRETFRIDIPYAGLSRITIYPPLDTTETSEGPQASLNFLNRFTGDLS